MILDIRKLTQQRHAQRISQAQSASRRELARQAREDKAIAEFLESNLPEKFRRM